MKKNTQPLVISITKKMKNININKNTEKKNHKSKLRKVLQNIKKIHRDNIGKYFINNIIKHHVSKYKTLPQPSNKKNTRTKPILIKLNIKNINVFCKIVDVTHSKTVVQESKLYNVTNQLLKDNVLNTIVYCYNNQFLKKTSFKYYNENFAAIITEDISTYQTFHEFLLKLVKKDERIPFEIIFQIIYTLHTFNLVKIYHTDLHGGNIFIQKLKNTIYVEYIVLLKGQNVKFYIPQNYQVKIIDFDLSTKKKSNIPKIKEVYNTNITNPNGYFGNINRNNRTNILKVIHSIYIPTSMSHKIFGQLFDLGIRGKNGKIPFFQNSRSKNADETHFKTFGYSVSVSESKNMTFTDLTDKISTPEEILRYMANNRWFLEKPNNCNIVKLSQTNLFK